MTGKEFAYVINTIENEGFEYTFYRYSNFNEINDPEFHKLRNAYLDARSDLQGYLRYED
jgi:hypothetical protein